MTLEVLRRVAEAPMEDDDVEYRTGDEDMEATLELLLSLVEIGRITCCGAADVTLAAHPGKEARPSRLTLTARGLGGGWKADMRGRALHG
mmetsp:Transcript_50602/g.117499  ORF Transcript_50602/g.117499 Transcript_50602/m.117499 type:complete len:90 (+) Transcript_50602:1372-1641(+)|eukprot:CAMPEP_0171080762 /NCGR_PEP_ID=MMETSP0766_2-20121228/16069_1 /TAXON_ID=439317 /ORGANISM="Gambierdiscus australes, Strain CAWD 149" /LENGTH=89 /DNA_ID=CAMNT_0011538033 /DNA_START=1272 /DNA_END=1541 /DNA_ORIENTATION=-